MTVILLVHTTSAVTNTLDYGVDPYNLGKGDWIWQMPQSITALAAGNVQGVVDYEKAKGMQWLAVKCGDGGSIWSQFNADLITRCHAAGMKVFGWAYVYGTNVAGEINVALNCLNLGADGLIVDAESQYETDTNPYGHANAVKYCQAIRKQYPNRFLAHGPSPSVHFHPGFPYLDFGMYCDTVMPQDYWQYRGITPAVMLAMMENEYRTNLNNKWVGSATNAIKPIAPVAQADVAAIPGSEESDFVYLVQSSANPLTPGGYHGVSFWDCQEHSASQWTAIGATNIALMTTNAPVVAFPPFNRCIDPGSNATFSARAYGAPSLNYQWRLNSMNIPGATGHSITITNAQSTNAGIYSVVVTNAFGVVTSKVARLTVHPPAPVLQLAFYDNFDTNSAALWNLFQGSANNISDFSTNWAFDYSTQLFTATLVGYTATTSAIPVAPNTTGGTRRGLKLTVNKNDATAAQSGVSLYPKAMNFGSNCVLRFDAWINYAGGPYGALGSGTTEMLTCGLNHAGTRVNWMDVNSTSSDGVWFAVDGEGNSGNRHVQSYSPGTDFRAYQGTGGGASHLAFGNSGLGINGAISEDCIDTFYAYLFLYPNYESPGAPGKRWLQVELSQLSGVLTWRLNGTIVAQRTNTSGFYSGDAMIGYLDPFNSISNPKEDNYVIIDNVRVYTVVTPPSIQAQPADATINTGANANFAVKASSTGPLTYQWRLANTNLPGATGTNLFLADVLPAQAGSYSVFITNAAGSILSSNALLTVVPMQISAATLSNGAFQLDVAGAPGAYTLLASSNLIDWQTVTVSTNVGGGFQITDPLAGTWPQRFYRVSAPK